jgi:hypothetical protein
MLPVIEKFMAAHKLPGVTVVADAGMISEANQQAIEAAGLSFILGMRIPDVPYQVDQWRREHPGEDIPDGHVFTQPWPAGPSSPRRDQVICYSYKADRARRTQRGIDEQVARAAKAVAGQAPVKRNRFIRIDGAAKSVNRELEARATGLAGLKGHVTNLAACPDGTPVTPEFVIGSYRRLFEIDLQARPVYHHLRDSIEAHLTIVFAALAVSRWTEQQTGWSIRKFVKAARRYRTIGIQAGPHAITAADPCPPTSGQPSTKSTADQLHTKLSQVRFFARTDAASTITDVQSSSPRAPSSPSTARCSRRHSPALVHCPNRRCTVWNGTPNDGGRSRHAQPLASTYTIAVNTARSSSGAVPPPCGRGRNSGINGSASAHSSSGTSRNDN